MKKLLISIIFILGTLSLSGQGNTFKYIVHALGGIDVPVNGITIGVVNVTATGTQINYLNIATGVTGTGSVVLSNSPTLTGTPVVPGYVPTSRTVNGHALTGNVTVTATDVGLGNVTNESKATMFTNPLFTGTPTVPGYVPTSTTVNGHALTGNISVTAADVSLGNVTNESKATMFTSPTFTGTPVIPSPFTLGATSVTTNGTELNVLDNIPATLTSTELGYSDGVTSGIQGQIDTKLA